MHPTLFKIPLLGLPVPAYGAMLVTGFLLAVFFARRRAAALGLQQVEVLDLGMFGVIGGVAGARLLHVILEWPSYFPAPIKGGFLHWLGRGLWDAVSTWNGGLAFYGGLCGGMLAVYIFARRKKIPLIDLFDFAAAPTALGLAITRAGCFLNGCCFGRRCDPDGPLAVFYPPGSHAYAWRDAEGALHFHQPYAVLPAQLFEFFAAMGLFAFLWHLYPRRKFAGQIAVAFGLAYAAWRFVNEFFRGDTVPDGPAWGSLTIFQYLSLAAFAGFGAMLWWAWRKNRAPFQPPAQPFETKG
jgi:phosphatidylglycerol:prolipoprotein diacylglycerol transferase